MKISVIVPVYNVEACLPRCMESLAVQTYPDREILLIDDGSTDGSGKLCDGYAAVYPDVRAFHKENGGLGMARNSGLDAASGEYVLFLDSDDYIGPRLLENLAEAAKRSQADLIIGGHTVVYRDGRQESGAFPEEELFSGVKMKELLLHTAGALPEEPKDSTYGASACSRLYRREIIERNRLRFVSERELISEDLVFNVDFIKCASRAMITTDASYFYCTNRGSLSKRHDEKRFARDCALYHALEERLAGYCGEYEQYLQRFLIGRARYDMIQEILYHDRADKAYPLRQRLRSILDSRELRSLLEKYPWRKLPMMQRIFALFMLQGRIGMLILLVRLKERLLPGNQNM